MCVSNWFRWDETTHKRMLSSDECSNPHRVSSLLCLRRSGYENMYWFSLTCVHSIWATWKVSWTQNNCLMGWVILCCIYQWWLIVWANGWGEKMQGRLDKLQVKSSLGELFACICWNKFFIVYKYKSNMVPHCFGRCGSFFWKWVSPRNRVFNGVFEGPKRFWRSNIHEHFEIGPLSNTHDYRRGSSSGMPDVNV